MLRYYASGCCKVRKYHVNMMYNLTSFKARGFIFFTEQLIWKNRRYKRWNIIPFTMHDMNENY